MERCEEGTDDAALQACQGALSIGAEDEFSLHSRDRTAESAAWRTRASTHFLHRGPPLRPGDRGVALGLVALTEGNAHSDAVALAARGSALITLRRGGEALAALRQAQTLAPSMPELQARIAQAKQLACGGTAQ